MTEILDGELDSDEIAVMRAYLGQWLLGFFGRNAPCAVAHLLRLLR